ncbi:MAG: hypothetical protein WBA74_26355, partial [Cyclobacteriaceae bacterium]
MAQPIVINVGASIPDGTYGKGEIITINITFDQEVFVTGNPRLLIANSSESIYAEYIGGSASNSLDFSFTVMEGMSIADLTYVDESSLELNGSTIENELDDPADINLPNPAADNSLASNS